MKECEAERFFFLADALHFLLLERGLSPRAFPDPQNPTQSTMAPRRTWLALAVLALALTASVSAAPKADKKKGGKENVLTGE